jgi:uncharacterized protein (TIGR03435 family)
MRKGSRNLFLLTAVLAAASLAFAQAPTPTPTPTYDVASIKPNKSGSQSSGTHTDRGGLTATNVTLRALIRNAYGLQDFQIAGGPGWVDSDRFDIIAKAEREPANMAERRLMMQALLAERFSLVAHHETRELAVYDLVLARPDGKLGAGLRHVDCAVVQTCGSTTVNNTVLKARGPTIPDFAQTLSAIVTRIVIDKTGLAGAFDIDLTWSRDQATDTSQPSIFTALQEQLGLKLEPSRGPVEVLVIDRVEPPTPD